MDHGGYPGIVPDGSARWIKGELLNFDHIEDALDVFDRVEGFHGWGAEENHFDRTLISVELSSGESHLAWAYATTQLDAAIIASGDWRALKSQGGWAASRGRGGERPTPSG